MRFKYIYITIFFYSILVSCENDLKVIDKIASQADPLSEVGKNVEIFYIDSNFVRVKVIATKLVKYQSEEPYTEMSDGVSVYFYNSQLEAENKISANYGIIYDNKDEMIARDNVVAINSKNEKLETEELIWNEKERKIYSSKFVKITTPEEVVYGDGFESNEDLSNYSIKNMKGRIQINDNDDF